MLAAMMLNYIGVSFVSLAVILMCLKDAPERDYPD